MGECNAKDFAEYKVNEIIELCNDLKYTENKELRIFGIEKIEKLSNGILEHLEYLELKSEETEE